MGTHLMHELDAINRDLASMGARVEEATHTAIRALVQRQVELVAQVVEGDRAIDALENRIDAACARVIALQQPVAQDLRQVLTCMVVNNELERMGDHAKNLAKAARTLAEAPPLPIYHDLEQVGELVVGMVRRSLDALVRRDAALARQVREADDGVDTACDEIEGRVVAYAQAHPAQMPQVVRCLGAIHDLERIADLATNIAKSVIYLVEGTIARHGGRMATDSFTRG